jgi:hypothetical protein
MNQIIKELILGGVKLGGNVVAPRGRSLRVYMARNIPPPPPPARGVHHMVGQPGRLSPNYNEEILSNSNNQL